MKKHLPKLDVENLDEERKTHSENFQKINQMMIGLGLEYTNKIVGKLFDGDDFSRLRDSIQYRLQSIMFHYSLFLNVRKNHLAIFNKTELNSVEHHQLVFTQSEHQTALFDSIIFHSISLFDYLGNLIDFICFPNKKMSLKWTGVVKAARDKKNKFSNNEIAKNIITYSTDFVDKLYEHRSELIHYKMDNFSAQITAKIIEQSVEFEVFAPYKFISRFSEIKKLSRNNRLTLNYATNWVIKKTMKIVLNIILDLFKYIDLNRKVPVGKEIFIFGKPKA